MVQVLFIDSDGYYTGKTTFVDKVSDNMVASTFTIGFVKPRFFEGVWQEGATEEEILEWEENYKTIRNKTITEELDRAQTSIAELTEIVL